MFRFVRLSSLALIFAIAFFTLSAQTPAQAQDIRNFYLVNGTAATTITHVYVAPSSSEEWGGDILGQDVLLPGEWVYITFTPTDFETCFYDIWVDGKDGETGVLWGVDICSTDTVTFS